MIVDAEKLAGDYLREHAAIVALGARLVAKTPEKTSTPWVRVTQIDAANQASSTPEHLIEYALQFDCYAGSTGGKPEASELARTVRAALADMPNVAHDGAVVTNVRFSGHLRLPDTDFEQARERYVLDASIWLHALAAA